MDTQSQFYNILGHVPKLSKVINLKGKHGALEAVEAQLQLQGEQQAKQP